MLETTLGTLVAHFFASKHSLKKIRKSTQIDTKSIQNRPQIHPTLTPKRPQIDSKSPPGAISDADRIFGRFFAQSGSDLTAQDRPKTTQRSPQDSPRSPQDHPKSGQDRPKTRPRPPKISSRWPKIGPSGPKKGPRSAKMTMFTQNMDFAKSIEKHKENQRF